MFFTAVCFAVRWVLATATAFELKDAAHEPATPPTFSIQKVLSYLQKKLDKGLPPYADDATINAYCNLSRPDWLQLRFSGWQNDRCVILMGGAEGYTNQILSTLRAKEFLHPRILMLLPIRSEHAVEAECLCKVLVMDGLACLQKDALRVDDRDEIIQKMTCRFFPSEQGALQGKGLGNWYAYWKFQHPESFQSIPKVGFDPKKPDHNCMITRTTSGSLWHYWPDPLQLRKEYTDLFAQIRWDLFQQKPYFAIHWRRGDQLLTKCKAKFDKSVNCQNVQDLRAEIAKHLGDAQEWSVYVATNEKDPTTLAEMRGKFLQKCGVSSLILVDFITFPFFSPFFCYYRQFPSGS